MKVVLVRGSAENVIKAMMKLLVLFQIPEVEGADERYREVRNSRAEKGCCLMVTVHTLFYSFENA